MTPPKKAAKKTPAAASEGEQAPPELTGPTEEQLRALRTLTSEFSIGKRIKEARERPENGLSIEALSRLCKLIDPVERGIAQQTLVKYEKGIVLPGLRELRLLCDALAVSADWMIFGFERGEKGSTVIQLEDALVELAEIIRDRMVKKNPIKHIAPQADVVRPMLLAKAKEPKPRK
jgi:transcriptional regulator with XRE-family HTH domain